MAFARPRSAMNVKIAAQTFDSDPWARVLFAVFVRRLAFGAEPEASLPFRWDRLYAIAVFTSRRRAASFGRSFSKMSIARHWLPSRPALNRLSASAKWAPLEKVHFTFPR